MIWICIVKMILFSMACHCSPLAFLLSSLSNASLSTQALGSSTTTTVQLVAYSLVSLLLLIALARFAPLPQVTDSWEAPPPESPDAPQPLLISSPADLHFLSPLFRNRGVKIWKHEWRIRCYRAGHRAYGKKDSLRGADVVCNLLAARLAPDSGPNQRR